jgi:cell division protein FtsL
MKNRIKTRRNEPLILKWIDNAYFFGFILFITVVFSMIGYLYIRNAMNDTNTRNLALRNACSKMRQEIIFLESEVIELKRPSRIQRIAREELGMINSQPQADAVIVTKEK